jgi:chaperone modulatory protein CbpM
MKMANIQITTVEQVDIVLLDTAQLAHACNVQMAWVIERVDAGLLYPAGSGSWIDYRFASSQLRRAREMLAMERDFDANPELAALVVDLLEEVRALKRRSGV